MVGPGFYPAGFPEGILPASASGDRTAPAKVPGAAGRPHAIARGNQEWGHWLLLT